MGISHSLAVQQVHDGLQDIVSILRDTAAGAGGDVAGALHLAQDVTHLLHTLLDVWLETEDHNTQAAQHIPPRAPSLAPASGPPRPLLCPLPLPPHSAVPGGKDSAQIIQDIVKFHLQLLEDITGFCVQLQEGQVVEANRVPEPALSEVSASQMHPWAG